MKKYAFIVHMEVCNFFENEPRETETICVTTTLEKAISVMETLSGVRYNAHRIVTDIARGYVANSKYIPISPEHDGVPEDYRYYYIEKVELL